MSLETSPANDDDEDDDDDYECDDAIQQIRCCQSLRTSAFLKMIA